MDSGLRRNDGRGGNEGGGEYGGDEMWGVGGMGVGIPANAGMTEGLGVGMTGGGVG